VTLTSHVITDLEWVIAYWPDLVEQRLPGTARPWRQPELSPDQRAERDHAARIEKAERSKDAWGETPAPVDVGMLDLLSSLLMDADILHEQVAQAAGVDRLDPPTSALADARPYLSFTAKHLDAIPRDLAIGDVGMLDHATHVARGMVQRIAHALCLVYDGQRLDVECPWCGGRTELAPVGGEKTWRVRELPGGLVAIVCESGTCEPESRFVGTWWRGKPCWPVSEWDWLAKQVTTTDTRKEAVA
jgi:hypothetical protein